MYDDRTRIISARKATKHEQTEYIVAKRRNDGTAKPLKDKTDWARVRSMTDEEVEAAALSDPDAQPMTPEQLRSARGAPRIKTLRRAFALTQEEFAARYRIPIGTLRDWEQGRCEPDQPAAPSDGDCPRSRRCWLTASCTACSKNHGHHVIRIYCKKLVGRMYEKFSTFLRFEVCVNEVCVNRILDLGLNKGLKNLERLRQKLAAITDRFADFEAQSLNVHVDFPLFQRMALPVVAGKTKMPASRFTTPG